MGGVPTPAEFERILTTGSRGKDVARLQERLRDLGLSVDDAPGAFGEGTRAAVARLQEEHGLPPSGVFDEETAKLLLSLGREAPDRRRPSREPPVLPPEREPPDKEPGTPAPRSNVVFGFVSRSDGSPLAGVPVEAIDQQVETESVLAEGRTDELGSYRLEYRPDRRQQRLGRRLINLVVRVLSEDGKATLTESPVLFQAGAEEHVDCVVPEEEAPAPSRFETISGAVGEAVEDADPAGLDAEQIAFVSGATGVPPDQVASYGIAARLASQTGIPAEVAFALQSSGAPKTVAGLLALQPSEIKASVKAAHEEGLVSAGAVKNVEKAVEAVREAIVERVVPEGGERESVLGQVLSVAVGDDSARRFVRAYLAEEGDREGLWKRLREEQGEEADRIHLALQLGMLTNGSAPLVEKLLSDRGVESMRDLASLEESDWLELIGRDGDHVPDGVPGDGEEARKGNYARTMTAMVEEAFPAAALAERISRRPESPLNHEGVIKFLEDNDDFDLLNDSLHERLEDDDEVRGKLTTAQRIYRVAPTFAAMDSLISAGFESASQIARMGRAAFESQHAATLGGSAQAEMAFSRADQASAMATAVWARYGAQVNGPSPRSAPAPSEEVADIPNWRTLFGSVDFCQCEHCRSVLSPAAYLVDLLAWLEKRVKDGRTALEVLLERRLELALLRLSCPNTNTPVSQVDLLNEVLEIAILRGGTPSRLAEPQTETTGTAEELAAHPQHIYGDVYSTDLAQAVYPLTLPFDLWAEEARAYLDHLGVPRWELIDAAHSGSRTERLRDPAIVNERLGLSGAEVSVLTGGGPAAAREPEEFWGYAAGEAGWLEDLKQVPSLLARAGIEFSELLELLATRFVDPDGTIGVSPESGCDLSKKTVPDLTEEAAGRLHRFLRLRRRLGWSTLDLDRVLAALEATAIDDLLRQLAHVKALAEELQVPPPVVASWFADEIDTHAYVIPGRQPERSPYHQLFLNRALGDPSASPLRPSELAAGGHSIAEAEGGIAAALGIAASDLSAIAAAEFPGKALSAVPLTMANLLRIYRSASLARALRLPVPDFLSLRALTGIDPFDRDDTDRALALREEQQRIAGSGLGIAELDFVLRHAERPGLKLGASSDAARALVLRDIREGLRKIAADHTPPPDPSGSLTYAPDPSGDPVARGLGLLLEGEVTSEAMAMLKGSAVYRVSLAAMPVAPPEALAARLAYDAGAEELTFTGPMTVAEKEELRGLPGATSAYREAVDDLFDAPRDFARSELGLLEPDDLIADVLDVATAPAERFDWVLTRLVPQVIELLGEKLVKERVAVALGLDASLTDALLREWVHAPDDPTLTAMESLRSVGTLSGDPLDRAKAGHQLDTLVRLEKVARVISSLRLSAPEVRWLVSRGAPERGWLSLAELPVSGPAAGGPARYEAWSRLLDYVLLRDSIPGTEPSLVEIFEGANRYDPAVDGEPEDARAAVLETVSGLSGWPLDDLGALVDPSRLDLVYPDDFRDERGLVALARTLRVTRRLGMSAAQAWGLADGDVTEARAMEIKQATKAKYDQEQWLEVAKQLRDPLRERQRQALVAFLLANPDRVGRTALGEAGDLSEHFLLDVEMTPCGTTSRIVQAVGAVQLFVNRALMNLEPDVALSPSDAREWEWMKRYRVWEANRKVFLWPENWIEPELRDDKTPFFRDLESELLQSDVTAETAESAFGHYLEKLDKVARLEVMGTFHEREVDPETGQTVIDVLHVVARTRSNPHHYYWRRRTGGEWTPWEKVEVEIDGDHVMPVVYNRRLYIFWASIIAKAPEDLPDGEQGERPGHQLEMTLGWTQFQQGKWTAKRLSKAKLTATGSDPGEIYFQTYETQSEDEGSLVIEARRREKETFIGHFRFSGTDGTVTARHWGTGRTPTQAPQATMRSYQRFVREYGGDGGLTLPYEDQYGGGYEMAETLGWTPRPFEISYSHQFTEFDSADPFFFSDSLRSYFVEPSRARIWVPGHWGIDSDVVLPWAEIWQGYLETKPQIPLVPPEDPLGPRTDRGDWKFRPSRPAQRLGGSAGGPLVNPRATVLEAEAARAFELGSAGGPDGLGTLARSETLAKPMLLTVTGRGNGEGIVLRLDQEAQPLELVVGEPVGREERVMVLDDRSGGSFKLSDYDVGRADVVNRIWGANRTLQQYRFRTFHHPWVRVFVRELNRHGIDGLMRRELQAHPEAFAMWPWETSSFENDYQPHEKTVLGEYPVEDVDFEFGGAYSTYNYELFFHAPMLIAQRLSANQRFDEAQSWFHYVFDPTDRTPSIPPPARYWRTRPFVENSGEQPIEELMDLLSYDGSDPGKVEQRQRLEDQVAKWRADPFDPHLLARLRPTAYQKAVVMKYVDNLVAWGDSLFRQDTMESVNEAAQLYMLAGEILGPEPQEVPSAAPAATKSFEDLRPDLDVFSNALVELENLIPALPEGGEGATAATGPVDAPPAAALGPTLYFCIPRNDKLLGYWGTVADRLEKIRRCENIEGVARQLALFAPPIDPGLLVRAAAAGVSIDQALSAASSASLPHYRFDVLVKMAIEICQEVQALGAGLLQSLEKRDAEELARLRSGQEVQVLENVKLVRQRQVEEAVEEIKALQKGQEIANTRQRYYSSRPYLNPKEQQQLDKLKAAFVLQMIQQGVETLAGALALIPQFDVGVSGAFGSPVVKAEIGGVNLSTATQVASRVLGMLAGWQSHEATMASIVGGHERRRDDWAHQADVSGKEVAEFDSRIAVAQIRQAIAERELENQESLIDDAKAVQEFLRDKFTNRDLYDWMVSQVATVYFQAYQLAFDAAQRAEQAFRRELGDQSASFVGFGYWDSLKKGLLAGDKLAYDLKRMQSAYLDRNRREYEVTKHVSLLATDPVALVRLKQGGSCFLELPESAFDADHPGQYMRRLKSVAVTIPSVTGPYTGVNCKLTLLHDAVRVNPVASGAYPRQGSEDPRFADRLATVQSIVTSSAQNDPGVFVPDLRDERYLPFEGAGAISRWRIDLPQDSNRFDLDSVSDVVLHLRYTAREGGDSLRAQAAAAVPRDGVQMFSARREMADEWHRFLHPAEDAAAQSLVLDVGAERFPFRPAGGEIEIDRLELYLKLAELPSAPAAVPLELYADEEGTGSDLLAAAPLESRSALGGIHHVTLEPPSPLEPGRWLIRIAGPDIPAFLARSTTVGGTTFKHLRPELVEDLVLLCHYRPA